jgi:hypothetical protein
LRPVQRAADDRAGHIVSRFASWVEADAAMIRLVAACGARPHLIGARGFARRSGRLLTQLVHASGDRSRGGALLIFVQWQNGMPVTVGRPAIAVAKTIWPKKQA